jgi:hypothetical protein
MLVGADRNLKDSLKRYDDAWKRSDLKIKAKPTTISWKVANKADLFKNLEILKDKTEQVHIGTVNERFIASVVLTKPVHGMFIIKILERRAGSYDPLGLDSIDYLVDDIETVYEQLKDLYITKESNEVHEWLSLRFDDKKFEAKFTDHLVLDVAIKELKIAANRIMENLK